jgi:hypothetical protein
MPQLAYQARQSLGPDPHLERVFLNVGPLDEQLDNPRLFGGVELGPPWQNRQAAQ